MRLETVEQPYLFSIPRRPSANSKPPAVLTPLSETSLSPGAQSGQPCAILSALLLRRYSTD